MVFAVVLVAGGIALGLIAFFFVTFAPPKRTAPGPLMLPFLGTALSGIYQLSFKDYKIMPALAKKYGKVFQLCYPVNMQPVYVIADSALAREVLTRKDDFHGKNPQNRASNLMTPNGLLGLLDNDMMKNHRRIMTTALFNREYLESYISTMNQKADVMIEVLNPHAGTGKPLDIKDKFTKATLDVILKLAFGYEGNSQKSDAKMFTGNPRFGLALFMRMVCPDWLYRLTPFKKIFDDTLTALHALANGVIRAEIEAPGKPRSRVGSILEALMFASSIEEKDEDGNVGAKMSVDEFKDEAVTILFAGHDTTAGTLGWVSYMLAKPENKHVVQKLREEIKQVLGDREYVSYEDLNKLVYCEAVFMETFRFFPTVPLVTRNCPKGAEIGGFHFEAGCAVYLLNSALAQDAATWKSPEKFIPERFLVDSGSDFTQKDFKRKFFPFGGGHRMCIGSKLATIELQLFLARLFQKYDISAVPEFVPQERHSTVLVSTNGIQVYLEHAK